MVFYYKHKKLVNFAEVWFIAEEIPDTKKVDIVFYKFLDLPLDHKDAYQLDPGYDIVVDLHNDEDALFSQITKSTKYKINRAKNKDKINCFTWYDTDEEDDKKLDEYITFFNKSKTLKNQSPLNNSAIERIKALNGKFCIRCADGGGEAGDILVMHSYIVQDNLAMLYHSASHFRGSESTEFRNLVGRANRALHWDDILFFKNRKLEIFKFGGWSADKTNQEQQAINQFKESFGGPVVPQYQCFIPRSLMGRFYVLYIKFLRFLKNIVKENSLWKQINKK
jgi:lipid II:glycine glycyltransferase (peptidoglycan interpeptide bridge formation enzyme)